MAPQHTILVVDDDADVRDMLIEYLSASGFTVLACADSSDILAVLSIHRVDLVLLDCTIPDGALVRFVPELRRRWPGLGIIVVAALGHEEAVVHGSSSAADDYVGKPFSWRDLTARIGAVLGRRAAVGIPAGSRHRAGERRPLSSTTLCGAIAKGLASLKRARQTLYAASRAKRFSDCLRQSVARQSQARAPAARL